MTLAYEEILDFIAGGTTPGSVVGFAPSEAARRRVFDLIEREKRGELSPDESAELDTYIQLEHLMRLAKAKARAKLRHE